jgi:ABC-type phosphate/phosphonate transport system substrate-binding protein
LRILKEPLLLHKNVIGPCIGAFVVILWWAGTQIGGHSNFTLSNIIIDTKSCPTDSTTNKDTFIAFVPDEYSADKLLTILCNSAVINKQFGKALVHWSHQDRDLIKYIGKGIAHLALVKENLMVAFATQQTHGYEIVGAYPNYSGYLISLKEKPKINKQYLWGKKLGLLDYASSRSGHIIPKRMLKDLGLSDQNLQITYANSHQELRNLLSSGEVDIIASYWQQEDKKQFSENYITQIQENISGSKWYLKMDTQNTDLACEIQRTLVSLTGEMDSNYFSQMTLSQPCPKPPSTMSTDVN